MSDESQKNVQKTYQARFYSSNALANNEKLWRFDHYFVGISLESCTTCTVFLDRKRPV